MSRSEVYLEPVGPRGGIAPLAVDFPDVPIAVGGRLYLAVGEDGVLLVIMGKDRQDAYHGARTALRCEPIWMAAVPDGSDPVILETPARPREGVTLRLFRQSRAPGFTGLADASSTLPWEAVEEVADLPSAERARVAFSSLSPLPDRSQRAVARIGCALARDQSFGLARFMSVSEVGLLVMGEEILPPWQREPSFASLDRAREVRADRDEAYAPLRADAPRSRALLSAIAAVEQVASGVLCGRIAPWARWGLLHRRLRRAKSTLSAIAVHLPEDVAADGALANAVFTRANRDPFMIAALCLSRHSARALLSGKDPSFRARANLSGIVSDLFPENGPRTFMAVDDSGETVRLGFLRETSKARAKARLAETPFTRVADLGRMLAALGDHMIFGSPEPISMHEVRAGLRAMRGPDLSTEVGETWLLPSGNVGE